MLVHLVNKGMANASALTALGTLATAGICGKLLFGWMSERFGARRMMMSNLIGQAAFAALLAGAGHTGMLAVAAPLFGLFMGGFGALYILVVQESFGLRHYGSVMGLVNLGTAVSFGLGPLIAGASYDVTGRLRRGLSRRMRPVRRRCRLAYLRAPSHPGDGYGAAAAVTGRDLRGFLLIPFQCKRSGTPPINPPSANRRSILRGDSMDVFGLGGNCRPCGTPFDCHACVEYVFRMDLRISLDPPPPPPPQ